MPVVGLESTCARFMPSIADIRGGTYHAFHRHWHTKTQNRQQPREEKDEEDHENAKGSIAACGGAIARRTGS